MKEKVLGYYVDSSTSEICVRDILLQIRKKNGFTWLACLNPHSYVESLKDNLFCKSLFNANWLIPDGIGVVLASIINKGHIKQRVTGPDIFFGLLENINQTDEFSVFFLGSTVSTLEKIQAKMAVDYPNIKVAGVYSPPFKSSYSSEELDEMIECVNNSHADILWVGMTAPKQEKWIYVNRGRLNVHFAAAIGAVFDFYAGNVKRSHPIFRTLGLEWLPRLIQQPLRLWRRTFISAPIFLWHIFTKKSVNKK